LTGHLRKLSLSHRGTNRKLTPEEEGALAAIREKFKKNDAPSSPFGHVKF